MGIDITQVQLNDFDQRGFFILEDAIPSDALQMARQACDHAVESRRHGVEVGDVEGAQLMTTEGGRYFVFGLEEQCPELYGFLLGDWAHEIIGSLTDSADMFHTEFVVKDGGRPDAATRFGWHQDGGYNTAPDAGGAIVPKTPHLSLWCALDDMSEHNGALRVLPFDRNPTDHPVKYEIAPRPGARPQPLFVHSRVTARTENVNNRTGDIAGYFGDDPGDVVRVPAGSVVVFSALTLHGSGANRSASQRRALNIAYSQTAYDDEAFTSQNKRRGVCFIENGKLSAEARRLRDQRRRDRWS